MAFTTQLHKLSTDQLESLHATIAEAGIIRQVGGDWRLRIRQAKNKSAKASLLHRVYKNLVSVPDSKFERIEELLTEKLK